MQHKAFHVKIQAKYDLGLFWIYSQALPNIENMVQRSIDKVVKVPKNSNVFTKSPVLSILLSAGDSLL